MKKVLIIALSLFLVIQLNAQTFGYFASAVLLGDSVSDVFYNTAPTSGVNAIGTNNFNTFLGSYPENPRALIIKGGEVKTWFNYAHSEGEAVGVCSVTLFFTVYLQGQRPASPSYTAIPLSYFDSCQNGSFPTGGPCSLGDKKWQTIGSTYSLSDYAPGNYTVEVYYEVSGTSSVDGENPCGEHVYDNNNNNPDNYTATFTIYGPPPVPVITSFPSKVLNLCPGTSVTLTSSAATGNHWSTGDTTKSITTDTAGTYTVTVTANGYSSTSTGKKITYEACGKPANLSSSSLTTTTATVEWKKVACAENYTLEYHKTGGTTFRTVSNITDTFYKITSLVSGTQYQWKVKTVCSIQPSSSSAYTSLNNFTTSTGTGLVNSGFSDKSSIGSNELIITPNPAHSTITVAYSGDNNEATVRVLNTIGQSLLQKQSASFSGRNTMQLDISNMPAGVYILSLQTKDHIQAKQFIKQ